MVAWDSVALQFWAAYLAQLLMVRRRYPAAATFDGLHWPQMLAAAGRNLSYFAEFVP